MERLPYGRHAAARAGHRSRLARTVQAAARATALASAVTVASVTLSAGTGSAAPRANLPSLNALLARAARLSRQIDALSQQYDGLRIQLAEAQSQLRISRHVAATDERLLASDEASVGEIAAAGYMSGGFDPTLQLLQGSNPQTLLNRAAIMAQLQQDDGSQIKIVATARVAAERARLAASQAETKASQLADAVQHKVAQIQSKENVLNSAAFSQAMAIYQKTGTYPDIQLTGDSLGVQAVREALTRLGDPYDWGAAGPDAFDCSGLVVWAFGQLGITLPHYTGDLWNSGPHIPRSELQPGDLLFFFPGVAHVGIYVGDGEMVDAPDWGQPVQVQAVYWTAYDGAVRIEG